ncbi:hypothetical protein FRB99_000791, partial [Tulasnella sp. 403]
MGDAGFFKGTSADQDSRFSDKDQRLRKSLKFPPEFEQKASVDMKKVALSVFRPWVVKRVEDILGFDDEVVVEYVTQQLEDTSKPPDPKDMQIKLTGFLSSKTPEFMLSLWKLLLSAQNSPGGVPKEFVEEKKLELRQKQESDRKVMNEVSRRQDLDRSNTERLDEIRERERRERGGGGGGGGYDNRRGDTVMRLPVVALAEASRLRPDIDPVRVLLRDPRQGPATSPPNPTRAVAGEPQAGPHLRREDDLPPKKRARRQDSDRSASPRRSRSPPGSRRDTREVTGDAPRSSGKGKEPEGRLAKSKWAKDDDENGDSARSDEKRPDLNKAERELKEKVLRQKVIQS